MSVNRGAIRSQVYALLHQTSSDTNFSDSQLNTWIDEAQSLVSTIIEYPRQYDSSTTAATGTQTYSLPSDWVQTLRIFFGDTSVVGDVKPMQIVSEEYLTSVAPGWLEATTGVRGRPHYFVIKDKSTFLVHPTPDSDSNGKTFHHNYVYAPASLSSDSSVPEMPIPYQNILKFYVAHLAYLAIKNQDMATAMYNDFMAHHKQIQSESNKETKQSLQWEWVDSVGLDNEGHSIGEDLVL